MFRPATNKPTPLEILIFLFAFFLGIVTVMLGIIVYLAYSNPERGYYWLDFFWPFLACLFVTGGLTWFGIFFLRRRLSGNPYDIRPESDYGK